MPSENPSDTPGDIAIRVANLSKHFRVYEQPFDRLKEALLFNRRNYHIAVNALTDISFTVRRGESLGVLGPNGAGKTSLLSILTGILAPTTGSVDVYGRVGAILGLGIGFLPAYTGRENLRNGLIARGVPLHELEREEAKIIEFSELGEAIDNPLRTYSAGMNMRLGFSLAISIDPDILVVDEALAVGDAAFQNKCQKEIRRFMEQRKTLVFVSHNMAILEATCERGILLDRGRIAYDGDIKDALRRYEFRYFGDEFLLSQPHDGKDWGDPKAQLVRAEVLNAVRAQKNVFEMHQGDLAHLRVTVRIGQPIERPSLGVVVRTALGRDVCGYSTSSASEPVPRIEAGEFSFEVRVPLNVSAGMYTFEIGIADMVTHPPRLVHIWEEVCAARVLPAGYAIRGLVDPGIELVFNAKAYSLRAENEKRSGVSPDSN